MLSVAGEFVAIGRVLVEHQQRLAGRRLQRAAEHMHFRCRQLLSCAWSSFFQPLAPSEHFSVAETTAVSYIIYYSHTTSRPGPSDTIQAQPTAHSDRSKRPEDAEKRLHF